MLPVDLLADFGAWKADAADRRPVSNRILSDAVLQFWPWSRFAHERLSNGEIPWTNPHQGDGAPFAADPQTGLFSPFAWLPIALPEAGWALSVLLKILVAGLGARALARQLGASGGAALLSGLVYAGSGLNIVWALYPVTAVSAVLPWLATALLRLVREPSPGRIAAAALLAALATAGGQPETLFFGVLAIAVFVLWEESRNTAGPSDCGQRLLLGAAASAGGFLALAPVVLPFLVLLGESPLRAARIGESSLSFRPVALVSQFIPGFLGMPLKGEIDLSLLSPRAENVCERASTYFGALALLAIALAWRDLRPSFRRASAVAAIALLAVLRVPPLGYLLHKLPLVSMAALARTAVVVVLFGSVAAGPALASLAAGRPRRLAGALLVFAGLFLLGVGVAPSVPALKWRLVSTALGGIDRLRARGDLPHPRAVYERRLDSYLSNGAWTAVRRAAIPGLAFALAGAGILSSRKRWLVPAAALGEVLAFGVGFLPAVPADSVPSTPPTIRDLIRLDPGRLYLFASTDGLFPANLATLFGLRDVASYDSLGTFPTAPLLGAGPARPFSTLPSPLSGESVARLAARGVRYFIAREPIPGTSLVGGEPPPAVGLWERPDAAVPPPPLPMRPPRGFAAGVAVSLASIAGTLLLAKLSGRRPSRMATYP